MDHDMRGLPGAFEQVLGSTYVQRVILDYVRQVEQEQPGPQRGVQYDALAQHFVPSCMRDTAFLLALEALHMRNEIESTPEGLVRTKRPFRLVGAEQAQGED